MKKILLDSQVLVWWLSEPGQLGPRTKRLISTSVAEISAIALFELAQKQRLKKLDPRVDFFKEVSREEINVLGFDGAAVKVYRSMPKFGWRDPFDHMIMAHSVAAGGLLVTADKKILACGWDSLVVNDARK